jgi:hypothetical protein
MEISNIMKNNKKNQLSHILAYHLIKNVNAAQMKLIRIAVLKIIIKKWQV